MTRIMLLATAMVLTPVFAMASSSQPDRPRVQSLGPIAGSSMPCTPYNLCAIPTPALGGMATTTTPCTLTSPCAVPSPAWNASALAALAEVELQKRADRPDGRQTR